MSSFIVFEGPEGAGKTTQVKLLDKWLSDNGKASIYHREPGGTEAGADIRKIILDVNYETPLSDTTALLLFAASYRDGLLKKVMPALKKGCFVLSDRTNISSFVYQRESKHITTLLEINDSLCVPDVVFLLLPDYEVASQRCNDRTGYRNRNDDFDRGVHEFRLEGYRQYAQAFPDRCIIIDPNQTPDQIHEEVICHLSSMGI